MNKHQPGLIGGVEVVQLPKGVEYLVIDRRNGARSTHPGADLCAILNSTGVGRSVLIVVDDDSAPTVFVDWAAYAESTPSS